MKISTLLNRAADHHLWDGVSIRFNMAMSLSGAIWDVNTTHIARELATLFICSLSLESELFDFSEFTAGYERQAARHCFMKFAALVAKEERL